MILRRNEKIDDAFAVKVCIFIKKQDSYAYFVPIQRCKCLIKFADSNKKKIPCATL